MSKIKQVPTNPRDEQQKQAVANIRSRILDFLEQNADYEALNQTYGNSIPDDAFRITIGDLIEQVFPETINKAPGLPCGSSTPCALLVVIGFYCVVYSNSHFCWS